MRILLSLILMLSPLSALAFDQSHAAWNTLLHDHVRWVRDGHATVVDYTGMQTDKRELDKYLQSLSSVSKKDFDGWSRNDRLAFLINAYNAFTVDLILKHYGDIDSIKDIGGWFRSPWSIDFISLFGEKHSLDDIEQNMLRKWFSEPRIHFAINCASVGCPALRPEAYTGGKLDEQLDDSLKRFLTDRTRNHYDAGNNELTVSPIFKWYGEDFEKSAGSVSAFLAQHADLLADNPAARETIKAGKEDISFGDYDWSLNTTANTLKGKQQ